MKKTIIALLLAAACIMLVGCSKDKAIWLQDGQTLEIIDNTLGEGQEYNLRFTYNYTNSVVNEEKGYVYILPVNENNPTERYFASIRQGTNSQSTKFIEITNVKNGAQFTGSNFVDDFGSLWDKGLTFADGTNKVSSTTTSVHYSSVATTTKYCYNVTKNNNITIWGDKLLNVTITSPIISANPVSFTVDLKDFFKLPLILSHTGDSWTVK